MGVTDIRVPLGWGECPRVLLGWWSYSTQPSFAMRLMAADLLYVLWALVESPRTRSQGYGCFCCISYFGGQVRGLCIPSYNYPSLHVDILRQHIAITAYTIHPATWLTAAVHCLSLCLPLFEPSVPTDNTVLRGEQCTLGSVRALRRFGVQVNVCGAQQFWDLGFNPAGHNLKVVAGMLWWV